MLHTVRLRKEIAAGFYFQTAVVFILISHLLLCCVAFVSLIPSTNDSVNVTYLCGVCFVSAFTAFGFLGLHLSISFYVGCFLVLQVSLFSCLWFFFFHRFCAGINMNDQNIIEFSSSSVLAWQHKAHCGFGLSISPICAHHVSRAAHGKARKKLKYDRWNTQPKRASHA